ncbi:hypothetical protein BU23DRAFT_565402 [Bimuria novae-zelandiae CBS 107.79]|uniref:Rhodopsin domain-containing protein n=1 Tax=Bimuria novae-zelandiae CBS 107.79 TaxID=1447943 RepID=A0A6A5VGN5_9PLEO|nr:hypothetical protein BU23DRAFT_565402 [Bimuria novae-zelandiae CBS 107.79]
MFILCMPIPVIRQLHVDRRKKLLIMGVFWLGFFCVVATAVRLYFGYKLSLAGDGRPVSDNEFSCEFITFCLRFHLLLAQQSTTDGSLAADVSVNNIIWAEIESCCSVVAACLPTYGHLVRSMALPKFITFTIQSLLDSVKRKSAGHESSKYDSSWLPISENHRNVATVSKGQEVELDAIESREILVERSFETSSQANSLILITLPSNHIGENLTQRRNPTPRVANKLARSANAFGLAGLLLRQPTAWPGRPGLTGLA